MNEKRRFTIALAGNPNVGKSTIFNALTNLRQHTGNWAGKTVACAYGRFSYKEADCHVVDLPGIYSLRTNSEEEEIAKEYICSEEADLLLVVCDATCPERGLHLLKQISDLENVRLPPAILCVNLCDEAAKKGIVLDFNLLSEQLKIPIIPCTARSKQGLGDLKAQIYEIYLSWTNARKIIVPEYAVQEYAAQEYENPEAVSPACACCQNSACPFCQSITPFEGRRLLLPPDFSPKLLAAQAVAYTNPAYRRRQEKIDRLVTGRFTGSLIMIVLLLGVFWLTITGANYPSAFLWNQFYQLETWLAARMIAIGLPYWFMDASVYGVFRVVAWIVSVMLPPMAIFFPLFTLLEDLGYLPRVAFNMDCAFKRCKACGKQCLTMCMVTAAACQSLTLHFPNKFFLKCENLCSAFSLPMSMAV